MPFMTPLKSSSIAPEQAWLRYFLFFFLIAFLAYLQTYRSMIFLDADSPWHLAAGDYIRKHGLPATDPWSFTAGSHPWYNLSWLYDVIISWIAEKTGLLGLLVAVSVLGASVASLILCLCIRSGSGFIVALMLTVLVVIGCKPSVNVRPQQMAMLLLLLTYIQLTIARTSSRTWWIWSLPIYMVLLVNMHGSFLAMFPVIGAFFLEAAACRNTRQAMHIAGAGVACAFATLINPYGLDVYAGALATLQSPLVKIGYIHEWLAPKISGNPTTFIYLGLLLVFPAFLSRRRLADTLLAWFWSLMALTASRNLGMQVIFATPAIAVSMHQALSRSAIATPYLMRTREYAAAFASKACFRLTAGLSLAALTLMSIPAVRAQAWNQTLLDPTYYPVEEISYLNEHYPDARIYNFYGYGGLLIYLSDQRIQPIIDGRADTAYPADVIEDYLTLEGFHEGWEEVLEKFGTEVAILPNALNQAYQLSRHPQWRVAYKGEVATVFIKEKPAADTAGSSP